MSWFLTGITRDLEKECRSAMLHDNMELYRLMVHFLQVEESRKRRAIHKARRPNPFDQAGPIDGGNMNNFGVHEQSRFKKGQQSSGNSNFQISTAPRGGRPKPKKDNGGDVQRPRKDCAKCGRAHKGDCIQGTNACFGCSQS